MATYLLTAPDGKKYKVTGNGSGEDALAHLQSQLGGAAPVKQDNSYLADVRRAFDSRQDMTQQAMQAYRDKKQSFPETALQIAGKGFAGLINDVAGETLTHGASAVTPDFIEQPVKEAISDGIDYVADSAVGDVARDIGGRYQDFARNNPRAARNVEAIGNIGGVVAAATPIKGKSLVDSIAETATDVVRPVKYAAEKTRNALSPSADKGLTDVGRIAQKYGIPLSLDQITGSRALKTMQKTGQDLPFSGQAGFRDKQLKAFNRALFNTVGIDADRFTPETMGMAFGKVGGEFDSLTKGKNFNIGESFIDDLSKTADEVESTYGSSASDVFQKEASRIIDDFKGNAISGELLARQRARINGLARKATDPNIKAALLDLENNLVDGITSQDPALQQALTQAKNRYKNLIVLEPIANKAKGGMISPSLLNSRVSQVYKRAHTIGNSGEIGDLARIGHELLPELGGSDSAQKIFYMGAALPTGFMAPTTTASALGANRIFQSAINRNQGLVKGALSKQSPRLSDPILPRKSVSPALAIPAGISAGASGGTEAQSIRPTLNTPIPKREKLKPNSQMRLTDRIKKAESGGDPNAKNSNSSASGLYQFTDRTWKDTVNKYGAEDGVSLDMKNVPEAQELMMRRLVQDNEAILKRQLGGDLDIGDLYAAHFLGAGDAVKLIKLQGTRRIAATLFPKAAKANQAIFFDRARPRTVEEVYNLLASKVA